jgi:hypothetical protein
MEVNFGKRVLYKNMPGVGAKNSFPIQAKGFFRAASQVTCSQSGFFNRGREKHFSFFKSNNCSIRQPLLIMMRSCRPNRPWSFCPRGAPSSIMFFGTMDLKDD